jgi:L-alanine-DL-glutamate epimerase-like enolase superfamily enzyme
MQYASLQVMSVLPHARWFEFNKFPNPLRGSLATPPLKFEGGFFDLPAAPGLGCELDPRVLGHFQDWPPLQNFSPTGLAVPALIPATG